MFQFSDLGKHLPHLPLCQPRWRSGGSTMDSIQSLSDFCKAIHQYILGSYRVWPKVYMQIAGNLPWQRLWDICWRGRLQSQLQRVWDECLESNVSRINKAAFRNTSDLSSTKHEQNKKSCFKYFRSQVGPASQQTLWWWRIWKLLQSVWSCWVNLHICWDVDMSSFLSLL